MTALPVSSTMLKISCKIFKGKKVNYLLHSKYILCIHDTYYFTQSCYSSRMMLLDEKHLSLPQIWNYYHGIMQSMFEPHTWM